MHPPVPSLTKLKILVLEDEVVIAMMLENLLEDFGCIVEIAGSIDAAMDSLRRDRPDGVLLDMNIHGRRPVAMAEELDRRGVPFLLVTGYETGDSDPAVIRDAPRLLKPFTGRELGRRMTELFAPAEAGRDKP